MVRQSKSEQLIFCLKSKCTYFFGPKILSCVSSINVKCKDFSINLINDEFLPRSRRLFNLRKVSTSKMLDNLHAKFFWNHCFYRGGG